MTQDPDVLAILAFPDDRVFDDPRSVPARLHAVARYRRNPRAPEYMRALVASRFPRAEIVDGDREIPPERITAADHIVLLWADAIGYGWTPVERRVFKRRRPGAVVSALTGRGRSVTLKPGTLLAFRVRRVVERLWIGELALAAALLLSAPVLVTWDVARGRR